MEQADKNLNRNMEDLKSWLTHLTELTYREHHPQHLQNTHSSQLCWDNYQNRPFAGS